MSVEKSYAEINEKIKQGKAVVVTAEEIIDLVREKGMETTAREVDVVTTGTFGTMCSSGAFLNFGHAKPRIKMNRAYLNGVPAYAGIAAVDAYIGATALPESDPENRVYPGRFLYGGGHVIEDLVAGREVKLEAFGYGTDCYPRRHIESRITLEEINDAILFNPRNAYQNYGVAVNSSNRTIYTYMGVLKPRLGNASYSTSGQLSPLLNDPYYRTVGVGTRIFLGGGTGYVAWHGTQHNPSVSRGENGVPLDGAGTLALIGDLKQMSPQWLRGVSYMGYGASLAVGIGIPIPILNEEILRYCTVTDAEIYTTVMDYSFTYPQRESGDLGRVSYAELRSGSITIQGKEVPTTPLSSYAKARQIAEILKTWITEGDFLLTEPVQALPSIDAGITMNNLEEKKNNR
ncbi:MAG: homocysteine biosynthesis protein [Syntrophaceticus sp.]